MIVLCSWLTENTYSLAQDDRDWSRARGRVGEREWLAYFSWARQRICLDSQLALPRLAEELRCTHEADDSRLSSRKSRERANEDGLEHCREVSMEKLMLQVRDSLEDGPRVIFAR